MKFDCKIDDFKTGDMVSVKKCLAPSDAKYGVVVDISQESKIIVKHGKSEVKTYSPNELKNITGGNT